MDNKKSIESLQFFVTHLAEGAIVHKQQGMIFKAQGLTKLGEKYIGHFGEEMGWVEKFTERILDLGGEIKFEGMKSRDLICDPVEYVKADLAIQEPDVELLMKCMEGVKDNPTVYMGTHTPQGYESLEAKRVMDLDNPMPTVLAEVDFSKQEASGKYVCSVCGYVYDPAEHDGVPFKDLPDDWRCPRCKQPKEKFNKA